jgi:hypothetical protein
VFRNKWFEFNLNSLGEFNDQRQDPRAWVPWDSLLTTEKMAACGGRVTPWGVSTTMRNNRPPYGWEEVGQVPIAFRLKGPAQLFVVPELAQDNNALITVFGYNGDEPVVNKNGTWGVRIPCRKSNPSPSKQIFTRIERVLKEPTYGFINLWGTNPYGPQVAHFAEDPTQVPVPTTQLPFPSSLGLAGGVLIDPSTPAPPVPTPPGATQWPQTQFLALYWPQDTEPLYRQIRVGAFCKRIRVRYRKNYLKVNDFADPIHVRNRTAVVLAMTGLAAMKQGGMGANVSAFQPTAGVQIATDQLNLAVDMLNDEWRISHPQEGITIQWDSRIFGNAFPQIM